MDKTIQEFKSFAEDVCAGLSASPKYLPSKYFYDERGDELFQAIMNLDEYYLTRAEYQIFNNEKDAIGTAFADGRKPFNLIELGAGDGYKTKVLLKHFQAQQLNFRYIPIDISANVLEILKEDLKKEVPGLKVQPYQGDYFNALDELNHLEDTRKVVLFLGSNIGNFKDLKEKDFFKQLSDYLKEDDKVFIGFDLIKDPDIIRAAYNDTQGITSKFNLNLLQRINDQLEGDFRLDSFVHFPVYDPIAGQAKSYLISREEQKVTIGALGKTFNFKKWEPIFMEVSKKYRIEDIDKIALESGFKVLQNFFDRNRFFVDSLWVREVKTGTSK